ncbi:hypothetical protein [Novosphingobium guangzhouense]|uniref:hypothetical protein n=1 Tax=Novosphingobium guangzhouense TaxID=1850347 RepID=UPI0014755130|nr:hypothetical protein [Novosphingobium guangzhouense]
MSSKLIVLLAVVFVLAIAASVATGNPGAFVGAVVGAGVVSVFAYLKKSDRRARR